VKLCPDGSGVIVTTSTGREIWLLPTEQGFETLLQLLTIETKRAAGNWNPQAELQRQRESRELAAQAAALPPKRYTASGKRTLTLADLGFC
jgi:hypothetical protein